MLNKKKIVEIRLWEFKWKSPYVRVLKLYSHVVFRMAQPLRQIEANIMATLGRKPRTWGKTLLANAYEIDEQTFHHANPSHGKVSPDPVW